jgi:hypothetical protein
MFCSVSCFQTHQLIKGRDSSFLRVRDVSLSWCRGRRAGPRRSHACLCGYPLARQADGDMATGDQYVPVVGVKSPESDRRHRLHHPWSPSMHLRPQLDLQSALHPSSCSADRAPTPANPALAVRYRSDPNCSELLTYNPYTYRRRALPDKTLKIGSLEPYDIQSSAPRLASVIGWNPRTDWTFGSEQV